MFAEFAAHDSRLRFRSLNDAAHRRLSRTRQLLPQDRDAPASAQFTPGFLAAQLLVHRAATSPVTEFGGNCIGGKNLRCVIAETKSLRDRQREAADRQTRNRRADVTRSGTSLRARARRDWQDRRAGPLAAHVLATLHGIAAFASGDELSEHAGCRLVHHGRMNDDEPTPSLSRTRCRCGTIQANAGSGRNGARSFATSSPVAPNNQQRWYK